MLDTKILFFLEKGPYDYKVLSHAGTGGGGRGGGGGGGGARGLLPLPSQYLADK